MRRGVLIAIEGGDRAGKSTQCAALVSALENAISFKFPDRSTAIGKAIHSYLTCQQELDDRAIHLLFSANRWESMERLTRSLEAEQHVILDRYCYSGVAYSSAGKGLSEAWCMASDTGLPAPDLVLYLDVPVEETMSREAFGEERYEKQAIQKRVRDWFIQFSQRDAQCHWECIDARQPLAAVTAQVLSVVEKRIQQLNQSGALLTPCHVLNWSTK